MSVTDEFFTNNASYAAAVTKGDLPIPPEKKAAIVACMEVRPDRARIMGVEEGDGTGERQRVGARCGACRTKARLSHPRFASVAMIGHGVGCENVDRVAA